MKSSGIFFLVLTSIVLVFAATFSALNFPFPLILYLICLGKLLLLITVFKVLRDEYTPTITFDEFYEKVTGNTKE